MSRARPVGEGRLGSLLSGVAVALGCVLFLGGFAWGAVVYKPYTVPTDSMAPTIGKDDRVLAQRIDGDEVRRGDVVVFQDAVWGAMPMVKRVVGVGGDKVVCCDEQGRLSVDGKALDEPYLEKKDQASLTGFSTTVPEGRLFLMGDHRSDSLDSRVHLTDGGHGAVPRSAVSARVDATAWPMSSFGMLERPRTFQALPGGVSQPGPLRLMVIAVVSGAVLILAGAAYGPIARRRRTGAARREEARGTVTASG
ncbi:signal peptidase I [Streptomyces sp. NA02950]|uniref:signal peptidase I n=1 Tax=Streptomyces sp. NA02950 TaxID=2742137 RepID=UPI00159241DB|nr:signal peptidase I [Streptomyces sp. NA02950]QKV92318.1 signal peptidase I [Streptomyces sp. NA02950]